MSLHQRIASHQEDSLPRIFGRYLLVERLSRGGMGEIFLARHGMSGFEKLVVIKKVLPHLGADREFVTRFIDEAQVTVHLQHANVAQVYEVGRVGDEYFLALEYIAGSDLRATMATLAGRRSAMPVELALFIGREVASGLAYAHRRTDTAGAPLSLVHCDISPPNLMLSFEGEVKIIDFGIARSRRRLTETNPDRGFGKFGYLAPEQLLKGCLVDQRTDVYALGVVLFEMLTGRHMFEVGKQPDYRVLARQVVRGEHPLPSTIDPELAPYDELVAVALRPSASERYQTAAEFRDAIQRSLIAVSPTINPDHLAAFLRSLHGEEVMRQRKRSALDKTDLKHWQQQLTSQASSTVSFARSDSERILPPADEPPDERCEAGAEGSRDDAATREMRTSGAVPASEPEPPPGLDAAADAEDQAPTVDRSVKFPPPRPTRPRRRVAVSAAVLVLAGSSGAGVLLGTGHLVGVATPSSGMSRPMQIGTSVQAVGEIRVHALPPEEANAYQAPPCSAPRQPARSRRKPEQKRGRDGAGPGTSADTSRPDPDAAEVQRRFSDASREYASFKERNGDRLESSWKDLSALARSGDRLAELDRKIGEFRARMRAVQQARDGFIDPFRDER